MSRNFVCLRITTMDVVDINLFRFDYDNTLMQFFMNAQGFIYARYGIRKDGDGEAVQSVAGVLDTMQRVLELHKKDSAKAPPAWKSVDTQDLASFKADPRRPNGCLHCHHAGYYVRKEEFTTGRLPREMIWPFPPPENIGLTFDVDKNTIVRETAPVAENAGIKTGDRITSIDGQRVVTPTDVAWALNTFKQGTLRIGLERDGKSESVTMPLKGDTWRKTDLAWRRSWWDSGPNIGLTGEDLDADERKAAGIGPDPAIAIKVVKVRSKGNAEAAGIQEGDVITMIDGKSSDMEAMELQMHLRLTRKTGDTVPLVLQRGKSKIAVKVTLK